MRIRVVLVIVLFMTTVVPWRAQGQEPIQLSPAAGNGPTAVVLQSAPIVLLPEAERQPLRVARGGSILRVVQQSGDWVNVRFQDPQFGVRTGFVQATFVRIEPVGAPSASETSGTSRSAEPPPTTRAAERPRAEEPRPSAESPKPRTSSPIPVGLFGLSGGGGVKDDVHDGGRVTFGVALRVGSVLVEANPLDIAISPGDTGSYYRDSFSNGQSRCRSGLTGQFASDSDCVAYDVSVFRSIAAGILVPRSPIYAGLGRRFNLANNPWFGSGGVMGYFGEGRFFGLARLEVGKSYVGGLAAFGVRLTGN